MRKLSNIFRLGVKELLSLYRDPVLIIFILFAFSIMIYAAGNAASQELRNAPIAILDEDQSSLSLRISDAFYQPYFSTPVLLSLNDIDPGLDQGLYTFVLDIPPNFQRDILSGKQPALQVNVDATQMTQAFIGAGYIQNIVIDEINQFTQGYQTDTALPISLDLRMRFNPTLTTTWFGSVMELVNMVTMLSVILTGAALIREREHGTLEHLLVMPLTPIEIMWSKVWSMGLVVFITCGLSLRYVIEGVMQMPIAGSLPLFMFGTALLLFSTTSLGILLGTLARTMPQLGLLMILIIIPLQMLSGGVTPYESMPQIVQVVMQFAPTTHFVNIAQAILYRGAGLETVWPHLIAISLIGTIFFLVSLALFRRSLSAIQ